MRRILTTLLLILPATPALADGWNCHSIRVDGRIIDVGTSEGRVWNALGQPDRQVQVENRFGAGVATRWIYYTEADTIHVDLAGAKVQRVCKFKN